MKERILQSLQGKATILEQYEDGTVFGVHFVQPSQSSHWPDGLHGYVLVDGDRVCGKDYDSGVKGVATMTSIKPETLAQYVAFHKRPGGSLDGR